MVQRGNNKKRNGQSLVEVMVAITALTVSFLGISALLAQSLAISRSTTDELTATYLASEGIEITKNLIDHDVYAGNPWGTCLFSQNLNADVEVDHATADCTTLEAFSGDPLYYHSDTHLYDYDSNGGTATIFTRDIKVAHPQPYEITVASIVQWPSLGGNLQSIDLRDDFYSWNATTTP
jgi:Tfp pilus assembly protein PilV